MSDESVGAAATPAAGAVPAQRWLWRVLEAVGPLLALVVIVAFFGVAEWTQLEPGRPATFLSSDNAQNVLVQSATVAIAALGMTIVIIAGGIDLSAGTAFALCATMLAWGLREDLAFRLRHGDSYASASQKLEAAQKRQVAAARSDAAARDSAAAAVVAARERLVAIASLKLAALAERPEAAPDHQKLSRRIEQLADPQFRLTVTPTWLEGVPNSAWTPWTALMLGVGTGLASGFLNGALVSLMRVVPFIVTLGTMTVYLGTAKIVSDNTTVRPLPQQVPAWIGGLLRPERDAGLAAFPPGIWCLAVAAVLVALLLRYSVFGRRVFAVGSNEATARLCGINVSATRIAVYTLAGLFVGLAGLFQFSRLASGNPTAGTGKELQIIAAVVIGGGSLSGGRASILGTLAGALIMQVISSGCTTLRLPDPIQEIIIGVIIIAAVWVDQLRQRRLAA